MNEVLRRRLLAMRALDERVRGELAATGELFDGYAPQMEAVHLENAVALEKMIDEHGWTGVSMVSTDGAEAAWLIVQHSISLPEFSRKCLELLKKAVEESEADAWQAAYLQDRIATLEGRPQRYGTQSDWNAEGKMEVCRLENADKVNEFRAEVGLKPLEKLIWKAEESLPKAYEERQSEYKKWLKRVGWRK